MKKKILFLLAGILTVAFTAPARSQEIEKPEMVRIPGRNYEMMKTEVTQELYESVMGENPSNEKGKKNPVEMVSWFDAICFCNRLSAAHGYTPVYAVENETEPHKWKYILIEKETADDSGETDTEKWDYKPHQSVSIFGTITSNKISDGYRLPTIEEWEFAAKGGTEYTYAGSNNINEVVWYWNNSGKTTHEVATKNPNGYGLFDMNGNVTEWCWDAVSDFDCYCCGGSWYDYAQSCTANSHSFERPYKQLNTHGFRLARTVRK